MDHRDLLRGAPQSIRLSVRDFFRTKAFIRIFDGFFLKTKGFLPKVYEIFGSEMPLDLVHQRFRIRKLITLRAIMS